MLDLLSDLPVTTVTMVVAQLAIVLTLAALNTKLVDYVVEPVRKKFPDVDLWWVQYAALMTGFLIGWLTGVNLFAGILEDPRALVVGRVLTSLALGAGSSLIHDWLDKSPATPPT